MATTKTGAPLDRGTLDTLLRRRLFYTPSFEIYGGVSGLYDYGPPGCALQAAIVDMWRKHFVLEEDMLEVDCTMLTPHDVLKTSGHVDKFADWMCKDPKSGEIFRADHLVEEVLEARLKGDKEARGEKVVEVEDEDKKKRKKKVKDIKVVKLDEAVRKEYEETLAKVGLVSLGLLRVIIGLSFLGIGVCALFQYLPVGIAVSCSIIGTGSRAFCCNDHSCCFGVFVIDLLHFSQFAELAANTRG